MIRSGAATAESAAYRSEEHTSELQSRSDLVCRLLLEKKKNIITQCFLLKYSDCYRKSRKQPSGHILSVRMIPLRKYICHARLDTYLRMHNMLTIDKRS